MFTKLLSLIMSFIISVVGFIPGLGEFSETREVAFAETADCNYIDVLQNDGEWKIFRNQKQFESFFDGVRDCPAKEYAETFDSSCFDNYNVVIINVVLPSSLESVHVKRAEENGATLKLKYITTTQMPLVGTTVMENSLIFVLTSKYVFDVELENAGKVELPFAIADSFEKLYKVIRADMREYSDDLGADKLVFSSYAEWSDYLLNGAYKLEDYEDMVTESFFANNNLVLVADGLASPHHSFRVGEWYTEDNTLYLEYWDVFENKLMPDIAIEEAILFAVGKNIDSVSATRHRFDADFILDGSYNVIK